MKLDDYLNGVSGAGPQLGDGLQLGDVIGAVDWLLHLGMPGKLAYLGAMGTVYGGATYTGYRARRVEERRYTGEDFSVRHLVAHPPEGRAHRHNVAAPAVRVVRKQMPWRTFTSAEGIWHTASRDYDEPHGVIVGKTGHGKNDSHLDPMAANVILHRPESAVIFDVKGAMFRAMAERAPGTQYVYTCLPEHRLSSAINLIATPEMTQITGAALWPTEHERQPFFNQSASVLFYGAAEHLGFGQSNMLEVKKILLDRAKLKQLGRENESIHAVMEGETKKSADEVVGTALLHLDPLKFPEIARMFDAPPGTEEPWFLEKETAWVCFPEADLIGRLAGALFHNLRVRAKNSRRGTYLLADEAGSVLTLQGIEQCFQVGRGYRTYVMIVLQDLSQLIDKFGRYSVYSILGNAPIKIFGSSDDPETREYFSALSGTVQIRRRIYEHDGSVRAFKQAFSAAGAPYEVREETRLGVLGEHLQALPRGSWLVYDGDPHAMELVTAPPFEEWRDRVMPEIRRCSISGVPARRPPEDLDGAGESHEARVPSNAAALPDASNTTGLSKQEPGEGEPRVCAGCGHAVTNPEARFCEHCGGRL